MQGIFSRKPLTSTEVARRFAEIQRDFQDSHRFSGVQPPLRSEEAEPVAKRAAPTERPRLAEGGIAFCGREHKDDSMVSIVVVPSSDEELHFLEVIKLPEKI